MELLFMAETTRSNQLATTFGYLWGVVASASE